MSKTGFQIEKAIEKHGNKYDYSKVEYVNAKTKICIICPVHKEFFQTPDSHINGSGCPDCGYKSRAKTSTSNIDEFIKKANIVHNNKYDYSKTIYVDCKTDVIITCPIHGDFPQKPKDHLNGGCYGCGLIKISERSRSNKDEFISKAIKFHGDKYDYSKVEYINSSTKVIIICKNHGEPTEFTQTPNKHLEGRGCPDCANISRRGKRSK